LGIVLKSYLKTMKITSGILIINKSPGPTSHDIVGQIRKISGIKKVGHAGTLDPFAQGILILLIGKATKLQSKFMEMEKTYVASLRLGAISDTYDKTGNIKLQNTRNPDLAKQSETGKIQTITKKQIQNILKSFIGEIEQVPPIFSAIKINGKRAYKLARKGINPQLKSRKIKIYEIQLSKYKPASPASPAGGWSSLTIEVKCGKGTYIRSLANDIGKKLGCGAYLEELSRIKIGKFNIKNSTKLKDLNSKNWTKKIISANIN